MLHRLPDALGVLGDDGIVLFLRLGRDVPREELSQHVLDSLLGVMQVGWVEAEAPDVPAVGVEHQALCD
jgi:hypothetical protein